MARREVVLRFSVRRLVVGLLVLAIGFGLGIAGRAVIAQGGGDLIACAKTNQGQLRLVGDPSQGDPSEYAVSWSTGGGSGGLTTVQLRSAVIPTESTGGAAILACEPGEQVTGGGWRWPVSGASFPFNSYPAYGLGDGSQEGWIIELPWVEGGKGPTILDIEVYALCAS